MIDISKLYLNRPSSSDTLRHPTETEPEDAIRIRRPVVVWNATRRCNLACAHCYSASGDAPAPDELLGAEAHAFIDDLARFQVPVLLFSGGEPLLRPDLIELAEHAVARGLRIALSTNATLIDRAVADRLKQAGVGYVGISLDGLGQTHDRFRGEAGGFSRALNGLRACRDAGLKVGVRYTVTRANVCDLAGIFALVREEAIPRICFYHLVHTGRAAAATPLALSRRQTRQAVNTILDGVLQLAQTETFPQILTVDNHADGPFLYLRMQRERHPQAERVLDLLVRGGGNSSGHGFGCVGWDGTVYPDQFWRTRPLGNVRERPFSEIWSDLSNPFLARLKRKRRHVKGRCATCRFLPACGGNFRARAEAATGDPWAPDPACYLTEEEIGPPPETTR